MLTHSDRSRHIMNSMSTSQPVMFTSLQKALEMFTDSSCVDQITSWDVEDYSCKAYYIKNILINSKISPKNFCGFELFASPLADLVINL
jgi:hypothetical protein